MKVGYYAYNGTGEVFFVIPADEVKELKKVGHNVLIFEDGAVHRPDMIAIKPAKYSGKYYKLITPDDFELMYSPL